MALHSKWVNGNLVFYDGVTEIFKIRGRTGALAFGSTDTGCVAKEYYAGTTGTVGISIVATGEPLAWTVVKGIVTAVTT